MRRSTKSELRMLREIAWHFCTIKRCKFCKKPLLEMPLRDLKFGARDFPPIKTRLAIHHDDEDRENNRPENRKPAHSVCHKRYHARKQAKERRRQ